MKERVLFVCIHNSGRSQMGEGFLRHLAGDRFDVASAGIESGKMNPLVVQSMAEVGLDLSAHYAKTVQSLIDAGQTFDWVITVCDETNAERCPLVPGRLVNTAAKRIHWGFPDPSALKGTEDEKLAGIRPIRDAIRSQLETWLKGLPPRIDLSQEEVRNAVRDRYSLIATGDPGCCGQPTATVEQASRILGYGIEELQSLPDGANLGLGCGNPQAIAALRPGETVVDLGSGGGIDCFLASRSVGDSGHVIGVDMTPDMVKRARTTAARAGYGNVEFRLGEIEHLPIADATIDVILSNCVINLSPDKPQVWREAFRVLRSGGRLAISDMVASGPIPESFRRDLDLHSQCILGATPLGELQNLLREAGFVDVRVQPKAESRNFVKDWVPGTGIEDYILSATIEARKP